MNEQRRQILQMLAENKITADEAERLLSAVEREPADAPAGAGPRKAKARYLRVIVHSEEDPSGPSQVNVRVPLKLLRAGVRLTSLIPPVAITRANAELEKAGFPIDLSELKPQHLDDLVEALDELTVDVDDPRNKVQVFCE
ncbi:SHOCT-like domain-containing protein [Glycomyces harbinensis]|uniref:YvlB/LiaX N-terminal domain-containing protein n=1 Tax=Glycomyces harbinensis TaxID=58114 RepID=A0A1G6R1X7_9ACTN|nr:hypothetical protein [Glycomyces harbinensis]SDC98413.1 hypothetical protein SAMN05216270_101239 [Glycomyces harbinensis]